MSKICTNCGNQMDDATMFCVNCGSPVPTPTATPAPEKVKKAQPIDIGKLLKNPKNIVILAGIVVALVLVVSVVFSLASPYIGWRSGLTNYFDLQEGKTSAVLKNIPKDAYEWFDDKYEMDKKDITSDKKDYAEDVSKENKDTYGDNVKYTFKVVKSKRFTKDMKEGLADGIENYYDIDAKKVKAAYSVQIEYDVSGKEAFDWGETMVTVAKIGNSWYVVSWNGEEGKDASTSIRGISAITGTETFQKEASKKK